MESVYRLLQRNVLDRQSWATRNDLRGAMVTCTAEWLVGGDADTGQAGAIPRRRDQNRLSELL